MVCYALRSHGSSARTSARGPERVCPREFVLPSANNQSWVAARGFNATRNAEVQNLYTQKEASLGKCQGIPGSAERWFENVLKPRLRCLFAACPRVCTWFRPFLETPEKSRSSPISPWIDLVGDYESPGFRWKYYWVEETVRKWWGMVAHVVAPLSRCVLLVLSCFQRA